MAFMSLPIYFTQSLSLTCGRDFWLWFQLCKHNFVIYILRIQPNIILEWMRDEIVVGKSTLVQAMAWCRQCWPRSRTPYGTGHKELNQMQTSTPITEVSSYGLWYHSCWPRGWGIPVLFVNFPGNDVYAVSINFTGYDISAKVFLSCS